jgi:hypothetical protein
MYQHDNGYLKGKIGEVSQPTSRLANFTLAYSRLRHSMLSCSARTVATATLWTPEGN